jgi:alpha-N-arabinofuranosidase
MSKSFTRRGFMLGAGAVSAAILTSRRGFSLEPAAVTIDASKEVGLIRPELHGQFAEHLGSCVYGGLWVGKASPVPNIDGYRRQAVEYLKGLVPVLRWPGGCFADDYHWRDGVGPVARRPKTVNISWGNYIEDNSFGTNEFIGLCRLIGAEPYISGNVGSGTPEELRDWMEYCNYPKGSSLADERAANGAAGPFNVKYWGVGNENWGCGGQMNGDEYATLYRRFSNYARAFGETRPFLVACGPNGNNKDWTQKFWGNMGTRRSLQGFAMHFYSNGGNFSTKFTPAEMERQFASFAEIEKAIIEQRALLDTYDPQKQVGLLLDEWGVWDRMVPEEQTKYGRLFQQITMRSAVAAALGLNAIHRQAGKLAMTNIAQIVNVLHSMLLTDGPQCVRTTAYYVYQMTKAHLSQNSVAVAVDKPEPVGLSVSASRQGGELTVTLVNPKPDAGMTVNCSLAGATARAATARILHDDDLNAANTFATPDRITPRDHQISVEGGRMVTALPPLSVVTAAVRLG